MLGVRRTPRRTSNGASTRGAYPEREWTLYYTEPDAEQEIASLVDSVTTHLNPQQPGFKVGDFVRLATKTIRGVTNLTSLLTIGSEGEVKEYSAGEYRVFFSAYKGSLWVFPGELAPNESDDFEIDQQVYCTSDQALDRHYGNVQRGYAGTVTSIDTPNSYETRTRYYVEFSEDESWYFFADQLTATNPIEHWDDGTKFARGQEVWTRGNQYWYPHPVRGLSDEPHKVIVVRYDDSDDTYLCTVPERENDEIWFYRHQLTSH